MGAYPPYVTAPMSHTAIICRPLVSVPAATTAVPSGDTSSDFNPDACA